MTLLTQRALRVFAVLEDYRAGSLDVLDAILPFFEPILAQLNSEIFDPEQFAGEVRDAYRWNFTSDIVEELVPRFEAKGWVEEVSKTRNEIVYRVKYDSPIASTPGPNEVKIGEVLSEVVNEFEIFITQISPLSSFARTTDELSEMLVGWLISIDAYSEDVLRHQTVQTTEHEGRLGLSVELPDVTTLRSDERYLCARFVKHLFDMKSPFIHDLCRIASVGLITEVVQDFRHPVTKVDKTDLVTYIDGPVALDLLGVSGSAAAANIRPLVKKLQEIGAKVRIFRVSVDELSRALNAVLTRSAPERTGPTAGAIRRNETSEAFVRQVAADPDTALREYSIQVVDRRLDQYPNEHEYFTAEHNEDLYGRMGWHLEPAPREHDCALVTQVQRMRRGRQSRDFFQSKYILVTRNALLSQLARRFCLEHDLLSQNAASPVVHQRQLATAIWLRTGLAGEEQEIPRRYILAACERVLVLKKNIVEQVHIAARNLTPEKKQQLELLLTQDRSVQVLMDLTLGASNIVGAADVDLLVDVMKRALVADIEDQKASEVDTIKRGAEAKVSKAHVRRRAAEGELDNLKDNLSALEAEDRLAVESLVSDVNQAVGLARKIIHGGLVAVVLVFGLLPLLSETLAGWAKLIGVSASGLIAAVLARFQILDRPLGIEQHLERWGTRRLTVLATRRGLSAKLTRFEIGFADRRFSIAAPAQVSSDSPSLELHGDEALPVFNEIEH